MERFCFWRFSADFGISIPVRYDWNPVSPSPNIIHYKFQFQLGTIGTAGFAASAQGGTTFQFQLGTIGTFGALPKKRVFSISIPVRYDWNIFGTLPAPDYHDFNSSKVRLERDTWIELRELHTNFNSSKVRLELNRKAVRRCVRKFQFQ